MPGHQSTKDSTPYTFQHVVWPDLASRIKHRVKDVDTTKLELAVVKAAGWG